MTEAEWLASTELGPMFAHIQGRVSDQKLRLFACACCRSIWSDLTDEVDRDAVAKAEELSPGLAPWALIGILRELRKAHEAAGRTGDYRAKAVEAALGDDAFRAATNAAEFVRWHRSGRVFQSKFESTYDDSGEDMAFMSGYASARTEEAAIQRDLCTLLREIVDNP